MAMVLLRICLCHFFKQNLSQQIYLFISLQLKLRNRAQQSKNGKKKYYFRKIMEKSFFEYEPIKATKITYQKGKDGFYLLHF